MKFEVNIKSGTGGWYDVDGCDMSVASLESESIPSINDVLAINREGENLERYLVRNIERHYNIPKEENSKWVLYDEFITVYVIPC
jgi:hypothetical protein